MLSYKRRIVVNSFWNDYNDVGFDRQLWHETSKSQYHYTSIEQDNGELIVEGLRQSSSARIPCTIHNVVMYLWIRPDEKYMCLMFHEVGQKELYVHRYVVRTYRND